MMLALLTLFIIADVAEPTIVYREKSPFATVFVVDEGPLRSLYFDSIHGDLQSVIDRRNPRAVPMDYLRVATAGLAFTKGRERALMIGLGGGAFPMMLRRHLPKMQVDAVEIDPVVVDVARRFFGVSEDVNITVDDGARFIANTKTQYDFILIDAYSGDGIPEHLTSRDFFDTIRTRLNAGGVAVANIAIQREGQQRALIRTISDVFVGCTVLRGREKGNVIVVAQQQAPARRDELRRLLVDVGVELDLPFYLPKAVVSIEPCALR